MAEMFGVDTPEELLTDEERRNRFFAGGAPSTAIPKPMEINRPTDVTPGIGRVRADVARSAADEAMTPTTPPPAPTGGLRPPVQPGSAEALRQQGPPKLGGWRKGLDIAGQILAPGIEAAIPGTPGNYQRRLGRAETEEKTQMGLRRGEADIADVQSQTDLRTAQAEKARRGIPDKPDTLNAQEAQAVEELISQGVSRVDAIGQVKAAGQKPGADKNLDKVTVVGDDGKPHVYGVDTSGKKVVDYGVAYEKPTTEPGNYQPVTNAAGQVVGYVDPKSRKSIAAGDIPGMKDLTGGTGVVPLKPSGQTASRMQQGEAIQRAGEGLIGSIQANRGKLGNWTNYWQQIVKGSPISDPALAGLQAELASFAALQPAAHGARGLQAIQAFENIIGGIPKDPDALIASIQAIQKTMGALQPPTTPATTPPREATPGMKWQQNKRTGEFREVPATP